MLAVTAIPQLKMLCNASIHQSKGIRRAQKDSELLTHKSDLTLCWGSRTRPPALKLGMDAGCDGHSTAEDALQCKHSPEQRHTEGAKGQ